MPSASTSTFIMWRRRGSSLSHSTWVRSSIAAFMIGTISSSRSLGHDETADVLRQVAREADQLARQVERLVRVRVRGIEAGAADVLLAHAIRRPAPGGRGEGADGVLAQPERLADVAIAERVR